MEPFSLSFLDVSQFTDACLLCACLKNLWKQLKPSNMCRAKEESKYICYELFTGYESCALMRFRSQCLISKTILAQTVPQEWEEQVVKERRQHGHQICVAWEYFESSICSFSMRILQLYVLAQQLPAIIRAVQKSCGQNKFYDCWDKNIRSIEVWWIR